MTSVKHIQSVEVIQCHCKYFQHGYYQLNDFRGGRYNNDNITIIINGATATYRFQ